MTAEVFDAKLDVSLKAQKDQVLRFNPSQCYFNMVVFESFGTA